MKEKTFFVMYLFYLILSIIFCRFGLGKEIFKVVCFFAICQITTRVSLTYLYLDTYDMRNIIESKTKGTIKILPDLEKYVPVVKNSKEKLEMNETMIEEMKNSVKSSMIIMLLFGLPLVVIQFSMILCK